MGTIFKRLSPSSFAGDVDDQRFIAMVRNTVLVALVLVVASEVAAFVTPSFPQDLLGSGVMAAVFSAVAIACVAGARREVVATVSVLMFGVVGWWIARAIGISGGLYSLHRDSVYAVLAGAHALLLFSAFEFTVITIVFAGSLCITLLERGDAMPGDLPLTLFYVVAFYALALVGIINRTRLQRAEREASAEVARLNKNLQREVVDQVERIRRAEMLGRYLPPEISEQVLASETEGPQLAQGRRDIGVLCATPVGFLESVAALEVDDVVPLVNEFVSTMSRTAFDHGGVIERFVGPRITVLFGAVEARPLDASVRSAVAMARAMQQECNLLLGQWEHEGLHGIRLRVAIGIAAGPSVVGTFGSERRVEYSALGDAMVRAHRLAATAIPGEIRLAPAAAERLEGEPLTKGEEVEFLPGHPEATFVLDPASDSPSGSWRSSMPATPAEPTEAAMLATTIHPGPDWMASTLARDEPSDDHVIQAVLEPGSLFDGRYRIHEQVGHGGTATVYRAHHLALDQQRAIKLIHPARLVRKGAVAQLRLEAEATSRIHHPNVVQLHDFGRSVEGHYYLALDFVNGRSLRAVLAAEGVLGPVPAMRVARHMLGGLQAAHELRLVHGDLKPGNVLIDVAGAVRVTDFGMAQAIRAGAGERSGMVAGTPAYMSPEQCQGRPLDGRSDLYSFGVTLYEMLSGQLPYRDLSGKPFRLALEADVVPLQERVADLPPVLYEVVDSCLARDPGARPSSALSVKSALGDAVVSAAG